MQFCYLILHYKNYEDTVKCIESIYKVSSAGKIVVVDNGSNDGSGEKIKQQYDNERCKVLVLEKNLGFSAGNNYGYRWIQEKENPDFVVIANNDVVFIQEDFEKKIEDIYLSSEFHVLGPDIYVPKHRDHQNPLFEKGITIYELQKEITQYKHYHNNPSKFKRRLFVHALKDSLCSHSVIIRNIYSKIRGISYLDYKKEYINVGLQGACLIFSKLFLENEVKAFDPESFLYEEEVFLYYRCMKNGYKMLYSPNIQIRHEEGASFSRTSNSTMDKLKFMLKHHVKAREELLEYLKEY